MKEQKTTFESITPKIAQRYFDTSQEEGAYSRPISSVYVHKYAREMKEGRWREDTGEELKFDWNGHLINGCHRMLAVVEAGVTLRFKVTRGYDPDIFPALDCGRHRSKGQLLGVKKVPNYNRVAAIVGAFHRLAVSGILAENNSHTNDRKNGLTNTEFYELYETDEEGFQRASEISGALYKKCRVLSPAWTGAIYYYLTHTGGFAHSEVMPFFDALFMIDTSSIVVVNMLRQQILKVSLTGQRMKASKLFALIAKTWNYYATGKTPKILRYTPGEEYPTFLTKEQILYPLK